VRVGARPTPEARALATGEPLGWEECGLALIGGLAAILLHCGVLSVASIVGFVTVFGIAARNGVLLVSHYQDLMRDEALPLLEAVRASASPPCS
jgi:Cu/Ag efflux pump CusA